ncbi:alpha/beta hydrolase [Bradyrhizobium sp. U87765 SZCCT0131]|uniref:alpha/beta fold hydrolase n=1 Tax=unclassified Bradyrhizobium TaxID=2631580 RepID=UPI001BA683D7|nr:MULTISPECIES: alpha/beta hydrolase [unclassified Bradyrhizobium]MBR1222177.1 alpha/beta hydrolase [Bradyrhizobium sp. U87765 SZCCT0131]MBR1265694.1 alpha/beta hydrolase [Bradyrhizobium sp. U87765 SZCCT0134]MBR1307878.1 alpha/beta hydrolase [Bradyrhizobium sp. U87765 SZCCT0110]MBR1324012.1 alpha/beta hydrolase [Bradyrhizobium sp. U87765 SZCCT0109]MBR1348298.1 alpha/beta hydrolase [Bradyrhizobium sp. U87765 SZCCT0048]
MIRHSVFGRGPTKVIALHGWFGDSSVFDPMLPALDGEALSVAFLDYRGYGRSRNIAGDYTVAEIAADALELADALGWKQFGLLGHSMGGAAALRTTVSAPARVTRILAATPVPASGVPFDPGARQLFESATDQFDSRQAIIAFSTGNRLSGIWSQRIAELSLERSDKAAFAAYFQSWSAGGFADQARGLAQPTLVLVGEHDAAVTREAMQATYLADYPNAELRIIPNAGHYPMQEVPAWFATEVNGFFAEA